MTEDEELALHKRLEKLEVVLEAARQFFDDGCDLRGRPLRILLFAVGACREEDET